jgi:hypothetical protein
VQSFDLEACTQENDWIQRAKSSETWSQIRTEDILSSSKNSAVEVWVDFSALRDLSSGGHSQALSKSSSMTNSEHNWDVWKHIGLKGWSMHAQSLWKHLYKTKVVSPLISPGKEPLWWWNSDPSCLKLHFYYLRGGVEDPDEGQGSQGYHRALLSPEMRWLVLGTCLRYCVSSHIRKNG